MSTKDSKKSGKAKTRGVNVKLVQEKKSTENSEVHVNAYFEKNDTRRKKKTQNKSAKKDIGAKKTTEKKETSNKKEPTKKAIKAETKKPASFSKSPVLTKEADPAKKTETEPEKTEAKSEKVEPEVVKAEAEVKQVEPEVIKAEAEPIEANPEAKQAEPEIKQVKLEAVVANPEASEPKEIEETKEANRTNETISEFETLKLDLKDTISEKTDSKIILRDVEKPEPKIEVAAKAEIKLPAPETIEKPQITEKKVIPVTAPSKPSSKEIKEKEIEKALKSAARLPQTTKKRSRKSPIVGNFGWTRTILAVACATTAIFAIVYFVNLTSTDMSLKVAAMQSGIEATYPSYIPRGYSLSDVTSSSGKVSMTFKSEEGSFSITEENTTWDSGALLNNYVKENYGDDYTVLREQGLTLYTGDNWEAWINGGTLYKLSVTTGSLTKKQMKTIATSL